MHSARSILAGAMLAAGVSVASAEPVVIGMPSWPSADVTAHVIARAAERMGVETELRQRGTMTMLADIAQGNLDVHPEVWFPNLTDAVARLNSEGSIVISEHGVPAAQNVCVTRQTQEMTGIKALSELADPQVAIKFDSDRDGKGEIWIGAPTWSSTEIEQIRARSYGYVRTMTLLELPEQVAMAAVDVAASFGSPVVFFCYSPHHIFDLHDLVVLEEPAYDPERWHLVKRADDPYWMQKSRAETAWDVSHFHVGYSARLSEDAPAFARFLANIAFEPADITAMSYAVQVEHKSAEQAAADWIAANEDRISEWMK
ncbi:MAG: substrate-binding domain-containing protein [Rhizobiaceae bacterium]|nr:substrate-binding domain-containing protein [Rhizobiaceae bacterium]